MEALLSRERPRMMRIQRNGEEGGEARSGRRGTKYVKMARHVRLFVAAIDPVVLRIVSI